MCVLCCSGAVALQPTVRAGSISLNSGIKPTAGTITTTTSATTTATSDSSRGSTLSKFSPAVVPVSRTNNNNNNQSSSSTLDDLRQQIADLRAAQLNLEQNQLTSSQVETAIENTVKGLDLTTTNTDLKNTLLDLQQQSTSLQTSVTALQNQADSFDDNIETTLDNRLKVRGLISSNNTIPFALKSEISPVALANTIVGDENATNTLANNIKPKESEIKEIIRDELVDQEILKNNGELNVEKKGEVQVTEETVTNALRNSNDFKQMVLTEIADNGGYVTTTALDNKNFLSTDSVAFANLATKSDVTPATIAANIADSTTAQNTLATALSGKVGPDANRIDELITQKLKSKGLVTNDENATRNVLTSAELETTLTNKRYATEDALNPKLIAKSIAESADAKQELAGQIGTSESDVNDILVRKGLLKDDANNSLNVATESSVTSRLNILNGGIYDEGSLLKRIADSDDLKELLRGPAGKDGSGYNIVGSADSYSVIISKTCSATNKGDAWVNLNKDNTDNVEGRLYICTCNGTTCTWPALGEGIKIKGEKGDPGEKGDSADSVWKTYCNTNDNLNTIIKPLYGNSKTCDNFTKEEYTALIGGPAEYCIKVATKAPNDNNFVTSNGLGKTLEDVLGAGTVSNLKSAGINANVGSKKFVFACTEKYDEIMNPKSAWYAYCTEGTNLTSIIQPLYTSSLVPDCKSFTEEQYNALMGGSKEYCMLIAKNAKANSDYLVATKGVGKTLEEVFGSGTVNNLKTNGLSANVTLNGQSKKFVFACAEKYDEIMNPKSAWYAYCSEGANLTSIIQPLYGASNVPDCKAFTQEQYNALMGGPKSYCLLVAKDVDSSTTNVKANLKKLFGDNIVTTLSSQKVSTRVTLNNQEMSFVDACAKKYEEIMAGKSGEGYTYRGTIDNYNELSGKSCDAEHEGDAWYNLEVGDVLLYICACNDAKNSCAFPVKGKGVNFKGESGENGKPASQIYCEAHAPNYPSGTRNYDLIVKLYPQVTSCDRTSFTDDMYAAVIGGAKSYCLSLNADFNSGMDLEKGVGLKMAKIYAEKKNVELSAAKTALNALKVKDANQRLDDTNFSILDECVANYNRIMSGDDAEDPWHAYCVAQNDKDTSKTNLEVIIKPLYGNAKTCDNFTSDEYNAIMGGAKAYCLSLAQNATTMDLTSGIGEKLSKTFGAATMTTFKETASLKDRMTLKTFTGKTASNQDFVSACEERYNDIMNPETAWHAYCVETDTNGVSNLDKIITPLYSGVDTCDKFTSDQYNAIMGGAKAYCLSLAKDPTVLGDLTSGIGKKLKSALGDKVADFTSAATVQARLSMTGFQKASSSSMKFTDACEEKYNEIMSGADATPVEQRYCEDNIEIVKKLYSKITSTNDCATKFNNADYTAIMGGAKAYCLSLVQNPSTLSLSDGIGKRLSDKLGATAMASFVDTATYTTPQSRMALTGFKLNKSNNTTGDFMTACEARYDEIMAGDKGEDGEDAATIWCKAHTVDANDARLTTTSANVRKMSAAKLVTAFKAAGNSDTKISKAQDASTGAVDGYFTDLQTCIDAVNADPTLMGGESAAETQYNEDVKKEKTENNTTFTLGTNTVTAFENKKNTFGSKMVTTDNIGSKLSGAGVMMASDINNENSITGQAIKNANISNMAGLGLVTVSGSGTNQTVTSNAVTKNNLATNLQTTLRDNSVQNSLRASGVMMSSDANTNMFSAQDVLDLLSGGVKVQQDGTLGINASSQKGAAIINKLSSAGISATAINNAKATTSIADKIATVAAAAAAATNTDEEMKDPDKCNEIDYMFWNGHANNGEGECQKCPDASVFKGGAVSINSLSYKRCTCEDPSQSLQLQGEQYVCVESGENECLAQPETYYWDDKCIMCPGETDFNPESLDDQTQARCVCKETGFTFDESQGICVKLTEGNCEGETYWSSSNNLCMECPEEAPYQEGKGCICKEEEQMFSTVMGTCMKDCPEESEYDSETHMCVCNEDMTLNENDWKCEHP